MGDLRSQQLVEENNHQKLQEEIDSLKYQLAEAQTHKFRLEKEAKDKNEVDESTAELVAERDQLKEKLTTVQNKLDGMYSENAKLATQKLTEVNRVYDKVHAIEAQLQKEQEEHAATKKQLLVQQQEVERLKEEMKKNEDDILLELLLRAVDQVDKLGQGIEKTQALIEINPLTIKN